MNDQKPQGGHGHDTPSTPSGMNPPEKPFLEMPHHPQERRHVHVTLVVIVGIIILLVLGKLLQGPNQVPATDNQNEQTEQTKTTDTSSAAPLVIEQDAVFESRAQAEETINTSQGKPFTNSPAEHIFGGAVNDPLQEGTVYFATSDGSLLTHFVGIYKFETQSRRWHRLHKRTYTPDDTGQTAALRVLGLRDRQLIVFQDRLNRQPAPCESLWLLGAAQEELFTLDLENPQEGLAPYTLDAAIKQEQQEIIDACQKLP